MVGPFELSQQEDQQDQQDPQAQVQDPQEDPLVKASRAFGAQAKIEDPLVSASRNFAIQQRHQAGLGGGYGFLSKVGRGIERAGVAVASGLQRGAVGLTDVALGAAQSLIPYQKGTTKPPINWQVASDAMSGWAGTKNPDFIDTVSRLAGQGPGAASVVRDQMRADLGPFADTTLGIAGELGSLFIGPGGVAMRGGGAVAHALATPVARGIGLAVGAGKITQEAATLALKNGELLSTLARIGGWRERIGAGIAAVGPEVAGVYGALMAGGYVTNPPGERSAAMKNAAIMALPFYGLSKAGARIEKLIKDGMLSDAVKQSYLDLGKQLTAGQELNRVGINTLARVLGTSAEGLGMEMVTDQDFLKKLGAAWNGDATAMGDLAAHTVGTIAGLLGGKYMVPPEGLPFYKAQRPELNDLATRLEAEKVKLQQQQAKAGKPADMQGEMAPRPQDKERLDALGQAGALSPHLHGMFQSGWDVAGGKDWLLHEGIDTGVRMDGPGGDTLEVWTRHRPDFSGDDVSVLVSRKTLAAVEGVDEKAFPTTAGMIKLEGRQAHHVLDRIAMHSLTNRAMAIQTFQARGYREREAGGPWVDDKQQRLYGVDLAGNLHYQEQPGTWIREGPAVNSSGPVRNLDQDTTAWFQMFDEMRRNQPAPEIDNLLSASMSLALRGDPQHGGVSELLDFMHKVHPNDIAPLLRPETGKFLAFEMGRLANGFQSSAGAIAELAHALAPQKPHNKLLVEPKPDEANYVAYPPVEGGFPVERPKELGVPAPDVPTGEAAERAATESKIQERYAPGTEPQQYQPSEPTLSEQMEAMAPSVAPPAPARAPRAGEAGAIHIPDVTKIVDKVVDTAKDLAFKARKSVKTIARVVAEQGGEVGRQLARDLERGFSRRERMAGKLEQPKREAEAALLKASDFLAGKKQVAATDVAKGYNANLTEMMHGRQPEGEAPAEAAAGISKFQGLVEDLGKRANEVGMQVADPETGKYETRVPTAGGKIMARYAGPDRKRVLDSVELRKAYRDLVQQANGLTDDQMKVVFDQPLLGHESLTLESPLESRRTLKILPDIMEYKGREYQFNETRPEHAVEQEVRTSGGRIAVVSVFGQDLPDAFHATREAEGLPPMERGLTHRLDEYATKADARYVDLAKLGALRLSGRAPDVPAWMRMMDAPLSVIRAAKVALAGIYDPGDIVTAMAPFFGTRELAGAVKDAVTEAGVPFTKRWGEALAEAIEGGGVNADLGDHVFKDDSLYKKFNRLIGAPSRFTETYKQLVGDKYILRVIDRLKSGKEAGNASWSLALDRMDFQPDDVTKMLSGQGGELYDELRTRAMRYFTGNFRPGESSVTHQSYIVNKLFWMNRFWMNRMANVLRVSIQSAEAVKNLDGPAMLASAKQMSTMVVGAAVGGVLSDFLLHLMHGRGPAQWWREMSYAPVTTLLGDTFFQLAGGTIAMLGRDLVQDHNIHPERLVAPLGTLLTTIDFAFSQGSFTGLSPLGAGILKYVQRMPLVPGTATIRALGGLIGYGSGEVGLAESKFYDWRRRQPGYTAKTGGPDVSELNVPAWISARELSDVIKHGVATNQNPLAMPEFATAMHKALGLETGQSLATRLRDMRLLFTIKPEQYPDLEKFAGTESLINLIRRDNALSDIADAYHRVKGTAQPHAELQDQLGGAMRAAQLGGNEEWAHIYKDTIARAATAMSHGAHIGDEWARVADAMGQYPLTLGNVLSQEQYFLIRHAGDRAPILMRAFMLQAIQQTTESQLVQPVKDKLFKR